MPPSFPQALTPRRIAWAMLLLPMLAVGWGLSAAGRFEPMRVPDTPSYAEFPLGSLREALRNYRTPMYPLFLRAVGAWSPNFEAVPEIQYLLYCLAVAVFFRGLLAVEAGDIPSALIAGTLLFSSVLFYFVNEIGTDGPAAAGAIAVFGFLLLRLGGRTGPGVLSAIALATFLTWLTRPAYLFLIVLVPVVYLLAHRRPGPEARRLARWKPGLEVVAAVLLPVLAYSLLQWMVVGRFAVVSFGGSNLIGIAGQFLEEDTVPKLPEHLQSLARQALENRRRMEPQLAMPDADRLNYLRIEQRYDDFLWRIFMPAAEEALGQEAHEKINSQLKELATAIIFAHPRDYLIWLAKAFRRGMEKLISEIVLNPVSLMLFLLALLMLLIGSVRFLNGRDFSIEISRATGLLFVIAVLFAGMKLAVVILVSIPIGRMTMAMGLFVPAVFMAILADGLGRFFSRRHAPSPPGETPPR